MAGRSGKKKLCEIFKPNEYVEYFSENNLVW